VGEGDDEAYSVVQQADGKLVVAGRSWNGSDHDFSLIRLDAEGGLDPDFGIGGVLLTPVGWGDDLGQSLIRQVDGKLVLAGTSSNGIGNDFSLIRLNGDGSLDGTFRGPASNTLGGRAVFVQNAGAVILDNSFVVYDTDPDDLENIADNYGDTSLTVARQGGPAVKMCCRWCLELATPSAATSCKAMAKRLEPSPAWEGP
jgi:uncharacterized delta-60 repeat protein